MEGIEPSQNEGPAESAADERDTPEFKKMLEEMEANGLWNPFNEIPLTLRELEAMAAETRLEREKMEPIPPLTPEQIAAAEAFAERNAEIPKPERYREYIEALNEMIADGARDSGMEGEPNPLLESNIRLYNRTAFSRFYPKNPNAFAMQAGIRSASITRG